MNPFDVVNSISSKKQRLIDETNEKDYNPFMVNRALSYYSDTLMYAQEMNLNYNLDKLMQHDYLFYSIKKGNRYSKWAKTKPNPDVDVVKECYGYNEERAKEALSILTPAQLKILKQSLEKGGIINKKNKNNGVDNEHSRNTTGGEDS